MHERGVVELIVLDLQLINIMQTNITKQILLVEQLPNADAIEICMLSKCLSDAASVPAEPLAQIPVPESTEVDKSMMFALFCFR